MTRHAEEQRSIAHQTLMLERLYKTSPARVYAAWADSAARLAWAAPPPEQGSSFWRPTSESADVMSAGTARWVTASPDLLPHFDLVPNRRIVFTEVAEAGGRRLSVSQITLQQRSRKNN